VTHLRIEGLTKRFAGKPPTTAMDDLSLEIEQGEFLVLLGPSGCGKTTTLRCLATRVGSPSVTRTPSIRLPG
jgi:iron(III) transport system ATP-binding protein